MSEALTREIEELRLLMGSARDPHGRVFAQLGDALRRAGSHREALSVLLDGVAEHPNFSPGHLVLGWTAQESGDLTVARAAYERTVELDPENPYGLFGLGRLLDGDGDPRGTGMIEEARALDIRVHERAPGSLPDSVDPDGGLDGLEPALKDLPFVPLAAMAPDETAADSVAETDEALFGLPFIPLEDLAPEADAGVGADESDTDPLDALPFIALEELRPDEVAEASTGAEGVDQDGPVLTETEAEAGEVNEPEAASTFEGVHEPREESAFGEVESEAEAEEESAFLEVDESEEEDVSLAGPLATRTMAELLVRQGLAAQAVEVFEALVERSPEDGELRDRLDELRSELAGRVAQATPPTDPLAGAGPWDGDVGDVDEDEVSAHPSMDPPVPHPEVPSPFHLAGGEPEEASDEEDEGVQDYFARLLAWSPGGSVERSPEAGSSEEEESDLS